ncbi:MAG: SDR family NAD(P)-dependent oxidoreductase, partial [Opitutaceae bacterium]
LDGIASNDDPVGIEGVVSALHLIQAFSATHGGQAPRLYFITRGAQPVLPEECDLMLAQSPLVGLMRVAVNEYQDLRFCTVDLDMTTDSLTGLMQEVLAPGTEEEIALRGGDRYVRRLVKKSPQALDGGTAFGARAVPSLVHPGASGVTTTLTGTEEPSDRSPQALQAGEVEIEIRGIAIRSEELAGLSEAGSRDARTHRLYEIPFSVDAVGVVANIADDVKEMDVGDRVFTSYHGRLSRRIIVSVDKAFALHLPAHLCAAELAAQIPAFIASHYSLRYLTKLKAGEKILVHNAADILGLTAIEVARAVGAHLYATVENRHQVAQIQSLGVDHILDAKSLDFADQMLELTNGRGVDVAFNTLSGEHASKTLSILSPLGRFIDVRGSKHKGLSEIPAHGNCFIAAVDVRQMIAERPHLFRLLMEDLVIGFQEEVFRPLPVATLTLKELHEQAPAFGDPLAESIALTVDDPLPDRIQAEAAQTRPPLFSGQGTYLVTGGFGGFGGETAKWLVDHGVRHIVLASRRGAATNEAKQLIKHLEKAGATVLGLAADISKEADVAE